MRILFVGDIVGGSGRRTLLSLLPALRDQHRPDFVVVNGERAASMKTIPERFTTASRAPSRSTIVWPRPGFPFG